MTRKVNHNFSKEEKEINLKFKKFYKSYMNRMIKNKASKYYKDHKTDLKKSFFEVEEKKAEQFLYSYIYSSLIDLDRYINSDIALPFENKLIAISEKWNSNLKKIKEKITINESTNKITNILVNKNSIKADEKSEIDLPVTTYSNGNTLELKTRISFQKSISINNHKRKKVLLDLVLENYYLNGKDINLCYPQNDSNFIKRIKFVIAHISISLEEFINSPLIPSFKELAYDLKLIVDELFYKEILKTEITPKEIEKVTELDNFDISNLAS